MTYYYTHDELKAYFTDLLTKNGITAPNIIEMFFNDTLETLKEYDGDPHGDVRKSQDRWEYYHMLEAKGLIP